MPPFGHLVVTAANQESFSDTTIKGGYLRVMSRCQEIYEANQRPSHHARAQSISAHNHLFGCGPF